MELPKYTNTNLMINYIIKIELALDRIKSTKLPKNYKDSLIEDVLSSEIECLSKLLNNPIGNDQARRVYLGKVLPSARNKHKIFTNFRNALELTRNYDRHNFLPPSSDLIIHINKLVGTKVGDDWDEGRFRNFSEKPVDAYDTWYKFRDYYTTIDFEEYFNELLELLEIRQNRIPHFIRYGITLFEMIDKAPLLVANQITSLCLIATLARDADKNPNGIVPFVKALQFIQDDVGEAYKLSKSRRDITPFLEAFLYSLSLQMIELQDFYVDTFEGKVKKHGSLKDKFNMRQIKALDYLEHTPKITREEYAKMMGVSFMTAYRDLQGLMKESYIEQDGVGRGTFYKLIQSAQSHESEPTELEVFGEVH